MESIVNYLVKVAIYGQEDFDVVVSHHYQKALVETIRIALRLNEEQNRGVDGWYVELFSDVQEFGEGVPEGQNRYEERGLFEIWSEDFESFRHPLNYLILDEEEEAEGSLDSISNRLGLQAPESVQKILNKNYRQTYPDG